MTSTRSSKVIPLKPDFDAKKLEKIKHTVSRTVNDQMKKVKMEIPKLSVGALHMEMLHFISQFQRSSCIMRWTKGPQLFEKFELHLQAVNDNTWTLQIAQINQNVNNFWMCVNALCQYYF